MNTQRSLKKKKKKELFLNRQSFFFWLCSKAWGILVPKPGIEPVSTAGEVQSLNYWTAREFPKWALFEVLGEHTYL